MEKNLTYDGEDRSRLAVEQGYSKLFKLGDNHWVALTIEFHFDNRFMYEFIVG